MVMMRIGGESLNAITSSGYASAPLGPLMASMVTHKPAGELAGADWHSEPYEEPNWRCEGRERYGVRMHRNPVERAGKIEEREDGTSTKFVHNLIHARHWQLNEVADTIQPLTTERNARLPGFLGLATMGL